MEGEWEKKLTQKKQSQKNRIKIDGNSQFTVNRLK